MSEVASGKVVNINTASPESLRDDVLGIGPVLAGRIVSYREAHGPFAGLAELINVPGIGPRLLQRIAGQLVVGEHLVSSAEAPVLGDALGGEGEMPIEDVAQPSEQALPQLTPSQSVVEEEVAAEEGPVATAESPQAGAPASEAESGGPQATSELSQEEQLAAQGPLHEDTAESAAAHDIPTLAPGGPGAAEPGMKQGTLPGGEQGSPPSAGMAPPASAPVQPARSRGPVWREVVLVLLGGLLGALLSLAVVLACSGTLDLAPQKEVSALSRNLGTMRSDQEMAWQRINELSQRVVRLEGEVEQLGVLRQRVADLEKELEAVRSDTNRLAADFAALRSEVRERLESLDRRISEMESALQRVQERVKRFDAFLTGLRDLLNGIEGAAPMPEGSR